MHFLLGLLALIVVALLYLCVHGLLIIKSKSNECDELQKEKMRMTEKLLQLKNENLVLIQKNIYIEKQSEKMVEQFKSLSNETVSHQSYNFIKVIEDHISKLKTASKEETSKAKNSLQEVLNPMENTMRNFEKVIQSFETKTSFDNREIFSKLSQVVNSSYNLQQEVNKVINSLRSPNVKGIWGEMQLKRLVQICGMEEHCDFQWQCVIDRGLKPDMVINLPNSKRVIVDSKVSLGAYINCMDTTDEEKKKYYLTEHARQIKQHINSLYNKRYWENVETSANFVILFLPGECFLSAALEVSPSMIEYASKYNIVLATPTTMIALLKTISYGWENIHISRDIEKIKMTIQNLYSHLNGLIGDMNSMGKSLNTMNMLYKNANNTLNYNIKEILEEVNSKYSVSLKNTTTPILNTEDAPTVREKKSSSIKEKNPANTLILSEDNMIKQQVIQSVLKISVLPQEEESNIISNRQNIGSKNLDIPLLINPLEKSNRENEEEDEILFPNFIPMTTSDKTEEKWQNLIPKVIPDLHDDQPQEETKILQLERKKEDIPLKPNKPIEKQKLSFPPMPQSNRELLFENIE